MSARKPSSAAHKTTSPSPPVHHDLTPADAYDHFLAATQIVPEGEVIVCRADLPLALHNVQIGLDSVRPHAARLTAELPALDQDRLWELGDLAAATIYAADRVSGPLSKVEVAVKLNRLRKVREAMLTIAEGLVMWDLLPPDRVEAIRAGSGSIDAARDGIALEALYRENAKTIANKHPFTDADLKEAADLGSFLVRAVTPLGGRARPEKTSPASQIRDRLYTLLVQGHKELRKAGHYLFGDEYETLVPPLAARVLRAKKSEEESPPEPSPGSSTA